MKYKRAKKILNSLTEELSFDHDDLIETLKLLGSFIRFLNNFDSIDEVLEDEELQEHDEKYSDKIQSTTLSKAICAICEIYDIDFISKENITEIQKDILGYILSTTVFIKSEMDMINELCFAKNDIARDKIIEDKIQYLSERDKINDTEKYNLLYIFRKNSLNSEEKEKLIKEYKAKKETRKIKKDQLTGEKRVIEDYDLVRKNILNKDEAEFFEYSQLNIYGAYSFTTNNVRHLFKIAKNYYPNDSNKGLKELAKIPCDIIPNIFKGVFADLIIRRFINFEDILKIDKSEFENINSLRSLPYAFEIVEYAIEYNMEKTLFNIASKDELLFHAYNGDIEKLKSYIELNLSDISSLKLGQVHNILTNKHKEHKYNILDTLLKINISRAYRHALYTNNIEIIKNILDSENVQNLSADDLGMIFDANYRKVLEKENHDYFIKKVLDLPNAKCLSAKHLNDAFFTVIIFNIPEYIRKLLSFTNMNKTDLQYVFIDQIIKNNDEEATKILFSYLKTRKPDTILYVHYLGLYKTALESNNQISINEIIDIFNKLNIRIDYLNNILINDNPDKDNFFIFDKNQFLDSQAQLRNFRMFIMNLDNMKKIPFVDLCRAYKKYTVSNDQELAGKINNVINMKDMNSNILQQYLFEMISKNKIDIIYFDLIINLDSIKRIAINDLKMLYGLSEMYNKTEISDKLINLAKNMKIPIYSLGNYLVDVAKKNDFDSLNLILNIGNSKDIPKNYISESILKSKPEFAKKILDHFEILSNNRSFITEIGNEAHNIERNDLVEILHIYLNRLKIDDHGHYTQRIKLEGNRSETYR